MKGNKMNIEKKIEITLSGETDGDIQFALEQVVMLLGEGYESGADSNGSGSYSFSVTVA